MAAWRAARLGANVTLLEKNDRIGIKILISGGGKCNITHAGAVDEVLKAFRPNEARFLRPSMYRFRNHDVLQLLTSRGLEVYTRPDGRIFPVHGTAKDVVAILGQHLREAGVQTHLKSAVTSLVAEDGKMQGVEVGSCFYGADSVVVSVGGSSYPGSGTTGDGWPWLQALGHTIVPVRAALAPAVTDPEPPEGWAGVALRDCVLKARQLGKEIARWRGDLLFTHHGVSGPTVLGITRDIAEKRSEGKVALEVDTAPDGSFEDLREEAVAWQNANPRRSVQSFVEPRLPERLVSNVMEQAGIEAALPLAQLTKKARNRLVEVLKAWQIGSVRHIPLEKGEVVAGGVSLAEVDPHTMASRVMHGLYLCGEVLDVAGPVGGYNLQAAFSTGYVAGESAAK